MTDHDCMQNEPVPSTAFTQITNYSTIMYYTYIYIYNVGKKTFARKIFECEKAIRMFFQGC